MTDKKGLPDFLDKIVGSKLQRYVPQDEVRGLTLIIVHTTPSEGDRAYANDLTPQGAKANHKLVILWKACGCVYCVMREAAVNDEMFYAGSSRSYYCFVPLRRAYNESTET